MFNNIELYKPLFPLEWKPVILYELSEWINGKAFGKNDYSITGIPVIKIAELNSGLSANTQYAERDRFDDKYHIEKDDLLFAWSGNPKTSIDIFKFKEKEGLLNQHIHKLLPYETVNRMFFYHLMKYLKPRFEFIASNKQTTGLGHVTKSDLQNLEVRIPNKNLQESISKILESFDDKIENNNAIISNLESQAKAIFKSRFINFEPFQDGEFVESKLGRTPEGWEVKKLENLFTFVKGKKPRFVYEERQKYDVPYVVKKYIDGAEISFANREDGILINELNVFMLMDGANSGNIYYGYAGILGSTFSMISTDNTSGEEYLYWYLKIKETEIRNQNTGSAIPHANKDFIQNIEVALPINIEDNKVLKVLRTIRKYSIILRKQNQTLAQLRDTLLPKLMSGEIRVGTNEFEEIGIQM